MNEPSILCIDAVPHRIPVSINENISPKIPFESILDDLQVEDYKSIFFLLMDFVRLENFFTLTKKEKHILKQEFIQLYCKCLKNDILIELFGTLNMRKNLRLLGTCYHVYENQKRNFTKIDEIWKVLYSLCEELIDDDVEILKQSVPNECKNQIQSAEDWFCWAFQKEIFSRTDLSNLEKVFKNFPKCLNIIKCYKEEPKFKSYDIRTPTAWIHCGLALIINFEIFNEQSCLEEREGSGVDVKCLKNLWENFGFKTESFNNLSSLETLQVLEEYAAIDHSNYDAFVCCILSHGEPNAVFASDGVRIPIPKLIATVVNNCESLNHKPKLFFIQACQGTYIHQGYGKPIPTNLAHTSESTPYNSSVPPLLCDVLTVTSSSEGFVSFRTVRGSWFIRALCRIMEQYGDKISIQEIMPKVNEEVLKNIADFGPTGPRNARQIVLHSSTLSKILILKKRLNHITP